MKSAGFALVELTCRVYSGIGTITEAIWNRMIIKGLYELKRNHIDMARHQNLLPDIFNIFCYHSVCY